MTPDPDIRARFVAGMSHAAATVNVVTTDGPAGRSGVTVSAMSSVSADTPRPTLLVCVNEASPSAAAILENGCFCVNVLKDDQSWLADTFAGRFRDQVADKFDAADWVAMPTGALRMTDPLVAFDCRVVSSDLVGTHHVFFGEVEDTYIAATGSPLIYARRAYGAAARIETPATLGAGQVRAANRVTLACFLTISAFVLPGLLARVREEMPDLDLSLIEGDQSRLHAALASGEAQLGLMYDENVAEDLDREVMMTRDPYVLLASDHPLAGRDRIEPDDLEGEPMVLLSIPPSPDYFLGLLRDRGIEPRIAWRSASIETVRGMVANGLGFTLLASRPASDRSYDGKRTVAIPLAWKAPPSKIVLVRRKGEQLTGAAERFAWACRDFFGSDLR